jgi:Cd2+/Zn2+-exporting ATPase
VSGIRALACGHAEAHTEEACAPCDDIVALAASVERGSEHPFAQAVLDAAEARRVERRYAAASDVQSHTGRGVTGTLDGRRVTVGNAAMFDRSAAAQRVIDEHADASSSLVLVGNERNVLGYIRLEDRLRESSRAALRALRGIDPSYRFVMLTGDRAPVARSIAERVGEIDEVRAELLPEQKLAAVRALEAESGVVAMVGDGINDTPALAGAKLGVAMGGAGSPQAMEVADVVLMQDDLSRLPMAVRMSRKTSRLIRENIALSLGLKLAFLVLAVPGFATLWMAVVADVGATVLVTLNGMRMLRSR